MHVSIQDFGSDEQKRDLVEYVTNNTLWHLALSDAGNLVTSVTTQEAGAFIEFLASDEKLNWIEYTVQFDV
jgi:hypothetical protein